VLRLWRPEIQHPEERAAYGIGFRVCLAKTPSGCKMNLVLKSETVFEGDFRLRK
jgi:hypothetical protein